MMVARSVFLKVFDRTNLDVYIVLKPYHWVTLSGTNWSGYQYRFRFRFI